MKIGLINGIGTIDYPFGGKNSHPAQKQISGELKI